MIARAVLGPSSNAVCEPPLLRGSSRRAGRRTVLFTPSPCLGSLDSGETSSNLREIFFGGVNYYWCFYLKGIFKVINVNVCA